MPSRNTFGRTPWGAWFVEALSRFDESGRLARGKSYANTGKVAALTVEKRQVTAKVRGRSRPWYKVSVVFPALPEDDVEKIIDIIQSEPILLAHIEAGELPVELLDKLKAQGINLFPHAWNQMRRSCDCPDWGDPCKHMASVYYMLAKEIDSNPRVLFQLRGVDLAERFNRPTASLPSPFDWPIGLDKPKKRARPKTSIDPIRDNPDGDPSIDDEGHALGFPPLETLQLDNYVAFISALLPSKPVFCAEDFTPSLIGFYHASIRAAAILPDPSDDKTERRWSSASYRVVLDTGPKKDYPFFRGNPPALLVDYADGSREKLSFLSALNAFSRFSDDEGTVQYRYLFRFFRIAYTVIRAAAFVPAPLVLDNQLFMLWRPLRAAKAIQEALSEALASPAVYNLEERELPLPPAVRVDLMMTAVLTEWAVSLGFRPRSERTALSAYVDLFFLGGALNVRKPGERGTPLAIASWLAALHIDFNKYKYRLSIGMGKLDTQISASAYTLAASVRVSEKKTDVGAYVSLKEAPSKLGGMDVLSPAVALSAYLPELRDLARVKKVIIDERRLAAFLGETSVLLSRLGVDVVLPKALRNALKPKIVVTAKAKSAGNLNSYLDLNSLLDFDWRIAIGDTVLDEAGFEAILRGKRSIVAFKDGFVTLDPEEAARLLAELKKREKPGALEALQARLAGDAVFSADAESIAASAFAEGLVDPPPNFKAILRPYQARGFSWILSNLNMGFGCVLADDMGLGKTVQAIAVLATFASDGRLADGALVVAPASLLTNWERELTRFAPGLRLRRYHGAARRLNNTKTRDPTGSTAGVVLLTTYQTAVRDEKKLKEVNFSLLIVDEAHLLKNAEARQSRVVKTLRAQHVLALSGTPVENRLEDLRSLFDLVIPGYLGGQTEFKRRWRVPIEVDGDKDAADKLKRITAPFLLRRLKTDKSIISDLPDKIQSDEYAVLTPVQAALYESLVEKALFDAEAAKDDPLRKGSLVLKMLTALKQICDHPRLYDKESPADPELSGKSVLFLELLETIMERREKVLVFSQYVECLDLLSKMIVEKLGETPLLYHGALGQKARAETADSFQRDVSKRIMLVSLRAGGLGLNLTAASRVIHYDLWFNPAVENQATDRAFRIGQTKKVFVHRLITADSFEEKIAAMMARKRELAELTLGAGEIWLSKLGMEELRSLFAIGKK